MKVAIVGAGFSGLACAWHLLHMQTEPPQVTLFDRKGIGGGASEITAGLIHPLPEQTQCFTGEHERSHPLPF